MKEKISLVEDIDRINADIVVKSILRNKILNRVLLIQRCDTDSVGANTWENAGGNVENGETLEEALRREIKDEVGLMDITIERVAYCTLVRGEFPCLIIVYLCETSEDVVTLSEEHQAYLWADKEECIALLPNEIIADFESNKIFEYIKAV